MKKCSKECIPCCDYCKHIVHEVIEFGNDKIVGGPIFFVNYIQTKNIESQREHVATVTTFGVEMLNEGNNYEINGNV